VRWCSHRSWRGGVRRHRCRQAPRRAPRSALASRLERAPRSARAKRTTRTTKHSSCSRRCHLRTTTPLRTRARSCSRNRCGKSTNASGPSTRARGFASRHSSRVSTFCAPCSLDRSTRRTPTPSSYSISNCRPTTRALPRSCTTTLRSQSASTQTCTFCPGLPSRCPAHSRDGSLFFFLHRNEWEEKGPACSLRARPRMLGTNFRRSCSPPFVPTFPPPLPAPLLPRAQLC
jgi:hypothetical protein